MCGFQFVSKKFPRLGLDVGSEWYNEEDREDRNTRSDCTFKGRTIGTSLLSRGVSASLVRLPSFTYEHLQKKRTQKHLATCTLLL